MLARKTVQFIVFSVFSFHALIMSQPSSGLAFDYCTWPENCAEIQMPRTIPEPALWGLHTDPNFNTTIRRTTDAAATTGSGDCSTHLEYSTFSAINSDGTKGLFVSRGAAPPGGDCPSSWRGSHNAIFDLTNGNKVTSFPPSGYSQYWPEARWDDENPDIIYFVYHSQLRQYNVRTGANVLLYDFNDYYKNDTVNYIGVKTIGDYSWDRRYFAFKVHCNNEDGNVDTKKATYIVLYDKDTNSVVASRSVAEYNQTYYGSYNKDCSFITMSPSGKYVIFESRPIDSEGRVRYASAVLDHNLNRVTEIKPIGADIGHCAWGYDWEGNEVIISKGWTGVFTDHVMYTKLSDGSHYDLFDFMGSCADCTSSDYYARKGNGHYFATIASNDNNTKGWLAMIEYSTCTDDNGNQEEHCWGDKELMIIQIKENPIVWRAGHNQNCYTKYWTYGRISFDQEGKYLYFDSNWRDSSDQYNQDIYRVELPVNWFNELDISPRDEIPPPSTNDYFITSYNFNDSAANTIASKYDLVITSLNESSAVSQLKKTNRMSKVLYYDNALTHSDEHYLYDVVTNKKIIHDTWGWYLHDITNDDYRTSLANYIALNLTHNEQFDGVFLDDCWRSIQAADFHQEGTADDPNLPAALVNNWETYISSLIREVKTRIGNKLVIINSPWHATDFLTYADGQMDENFAHANWEKPAEFLGVDSWRNHLNALYNATSNSKYYLAQAGVSDGATQEQINKLVRYSFASFLMGIPPNNKYAKHYFVPSLSYSNYYWYSDWDVTLGEPLGDYFEVQGIRNCYRRNFVNGTVLINPTDANIDNIELEDTFLTLENNPVTQVSLSAREGLILLHFENTLLSPPTGLRIINVSP